MTLVPGNTMHIPDTGPPHEKGRQHLFVVLTKPCSNGMVLAAPICTIRSKHDPACTVATGEHNFVTAESYVAYHFANRYKAEVLERQIEKGIIRPDTDVTSALLKRICDGISKSKQAPPKEQKYYAEQVAATSIADKSPPAVPSVASAR